MSVAACLSAKDIIEQLYALANTDHEQYCAFVRTHVSESYAYRDMDSKHDERGRDAMLLANRQLRAALPDVRVTLRHVMSQERRVAAQFSAVGTFSGESWHGVPANARRVEFGGMLMCEFDGDNKLQRSTVAWNKSALLAQLLAAPLALASLETLIEQVSDSRLQFVLFRLPEKIVLCAGSEECVLDADAARAWLTPTSTCFIYCSMPRNKKLIRVVWSGENASRGALAHLSQGRALLEQLVTIHSNTHTVFTLDELTEILSRA